MALALTSRLDAVNKCLEAVWERPVSSLEVAGVASVAQAVRVLDDTTRAVQTTGYAFNTEENVTLTPDVNGYIYIPNNTLDVDSFGCDADMDVVQRGVKLYNRTDHTLVFTAPIKVRLILLMDWEDLPEAARAYIACMAARTFADAWLKRGNTDATPAEKKALTNLEEHEATTNDANMFTDSWSVAQILMR